MATAQDKALEIMMKVQEFTKTQMEVIGYEILDDYDKSKEKRKEHKKQYKELLKTIMGHVEDD